MHGPNSSLGGSLKAPTWPNLPKIKVLDTIAPTLRIKRARLWRKRRAAALDRWRVTGLRFDVVEASPILYPVLDPNGGDAGLPKAMVNPCLRLMSMSGLYGGSIPAVATWLPETDPAALAAFYMKDFWLHSALVQSYRLTHEIGHCLGLNHHTGANSVMGVSSSGYWMGTAQPDSHDIESLKEWYRV